MSELPGYALIASSIIAVIVGIIVAFRRGTSKPIKIFFMISMIACGVWALWLSFFIRQSEEITIIPIAKVYYIAAAVIAWSWLSLAYCLISNKSRNIMKFSAISFLPFLVLSLGIAINSDILISSTTVGKTNSVELNRLGYALYSFYFIGYCLVAFSLLLVGWARAKNYLEKKRSQYITVAFASSFVFGAYFNLILPWFGNYSLVWVGPINIMLFSFIIYAAIAKYRLFNVRLQAIRLVSAVLLAIVFFWLYWAIVSMTYNGYDIPAGVLLTSTFLLIGLIVSIYLIMKLIMRSSERWLGKGLNSDNLIGKLSKEAILSTNTRSAIHRLSEILSTEINPSSAVVAVKDYEKWIISSDKLAKDLMISISNSEIIESTDIVVTEELSAYSDLYNLLRANNISVIIKTRLGRRGRDTSAGTSYLIILNNRRTLYSSKEVDVLLSIGGIIAVTLENNLYFESIKNFNKKLEDEVSDATAGLRTANRKLKKLDDAKDDFISMASHQLRTPLTSVRGYLSMLQDGDFGRMTNEQKRVLGEAYSSSERMAFLISDFLDVSRLQAGRFELQKAPTHLGELLSSEIEHLKGTAKSKNITIDYSPPSNLPVIEADHNKIRQVTMNMIDNAIYYSPEGSTVTVSLYKQKNDIILTVKDFGIGVPASEQSKLFTKFYRATNARRARPDGTGVGLYMAKKIIVMHGGSIIFDSHENRGSIFGFRLPI